MSDKKRLQIYLFSWRDRPTLSICYNGLVALKHCCSMNKFDLMNFTDNVKTHIVSCKKTRRLILLHKNLLITFRFVTLDQSHTNCTLMMIGFFASALFCQWTHHSCWTVAWNKRKKNIYLFRSSLCLQLNDYTLVVHYVYW